MKDRLMVLGPYPLALTMVNFRVEHMFAGAWKIGLSRFVGVSDD